MNTKTMTIVHTIIDELNEAGLNAEWGNTGGNCMAILVGLPDGGELLISDLEGPFTHADLDSDDEVEGLFVGRYNSDGEPMGEVSAIKLTPYENPQHHEGVETCTRLLAIDCTVARVKIAAREAGADVA